VRKSLVTKILVLAVSLAFLAVLPPAMGDLLGKDNPTLSRADAFRSLDHPRPTLDMVQLQAPK
jgi:hypothetical protein